LLAIADGIIQSCNVLGDKPCWICRQHADELRAHAAYLETAPQWISFESEQPAEGQIVVVHGGIALYQGGVFYTGVEVPQFRRAIQWRVTHWMPLPKPPEAR
jgi:hypothetical protein